MKANYLFLGTLLVCAIVCSYSANAVVNSNVYANAISARNIAVIQHSVNINAMQTFEGTYSAALSGCRRGNLTSPVVNDNAIEVSAVELYGRAPMYGTPDDEYIYGRNAGDDGFAHNTWGNWKHFNEMGNFQNAEQLDSDYDLVMFGISSGTKQSVDVLSEWGVFGGYIGGEQKLNDLVINEYGGYLGLYQGFNIRGLGVAMTLNAGVLSDNSAYGQFGTDEFVNIWAGGALNATYNILLDDTFALQPGVYVGYTWVKSANYVDYAGDKISNKNFNMLEVSPALRAVKHIGNDWFGYLDARYVFAFSGGGALAVNGVAQSALYDEEYSEYGIGVEKSIDNFSLSVSLHRRDGIRSGWNGGFSIKCIF